MRARRPERAALVLACALVLGAPCAAGEQRLLVEGLADVELWETDPSSSLARDAGRGAGGVRLRLWAAAALHERLQLFAAGLAEAGEGLEPAVEGHDALLLEQAYLRVGFARARLRLEAGRIAPPVGSASTRALSSANPLIGQVGGYEQDYPLGLRALGWTERLDYTLALIDRPLLGGAYLPHPDPALHVAVGAGVRPAIGVRVAAWASQGPYLNAALAAAAPDVGAWRELEQRLAALELELSRGYGVVRAEVLRTHHDVPDGAPVRGTSWFIEPVYTWTPRLYTALRVERAEDPYVALRDEGWRTTALGRYDVEAGAGWRLAPGSVLKLAYRHRHWTLAAPIAAYYPDGHALSVQLSYRFDALAPFERR